MIHARAPTVLLAKKPKEPENPQPQETLPGHIQDVFNTTQALIDRTGLQALNSMGFDSNLLQDLSGAVLRAAHLHDLGKANSQFQNAMRQGNPILQSLRHEWISAWLPIKFPELDRWIFSGCKDMVRYSVLFAVIGHHLKIDDGSTVGNRSDMGDTNLTIFCGHPNFTECLTSANYNKGLTFELPSLANIEIDLLDRPLGELRDWLPGAVRWHENVGEDIHRFVALVKAILIAADVAGSAVPKQGVDPAAWTNRVLSRFCSGDELNKIVKAKLKGKKTRHFQKQVALSKNPVTFVKAGCGSGKTLAAYLWATKNASGRKLFFCYPTTGTATEGFSDYIIPSELKTQATLLHSRSQYDLEYLRDTQSEGIYEPLTRFESLVAWDVPLIICTADQVLGLIQNGRRALFSFPPMATGSFVFDEIHQYDDRLFGSLLRFLEAFNATPILLMTASLPKPRLKAIQSILKKSSIPLNLIQGPADLENIKRYQIEKLLKAVPWERISETINQAGKVLWVANTVDRSREFACEALRRGFKPLIYHSRYRYVDRIKRHKAVVDAFKSIGASFAITTQVCEVSLDLSADLLITDLAPVPSLIQRMGRLNRRVTPENPGKPKPVLFLEPETPLPYETEDLEAARNWISGFVAGPQSQTDLASAFERMMIKNPEVPLVKSAWLDGGPFSAPAPLREAGSTIPVIRQEDKPLCIDKKGNPSTKQITRYSIPMSLGLVIHEIYGWKRLGFVFVAPVGRIEYSEELGAKWSKRQNS